MQELDFFKYSVGQNQPVVNYLVCDTDASKIQVEPQTMMGAPSESEQYYEVEYPVRSKFLADQQIQKANYQQDGFETIYTPFERDRVDFSTFLSTPHIVKTYAKTYFSVDKAEDLTFLLETCGGIKIWVNQQLQIMFTPYTRNHGSQKKIILNLEKGLNEIEIYFDDLAERDINYYFSLVNLNKHSLQGQIPINESEMEYENAVDLLDSFSLSQDYYEKGSVKLDYSNKVMATEVADLKVVMNPPQLLVDNDAQSGDITDFKVDNFSIKIKKSVNEQVLCAVDSIETAGLTRFRFCKKLSNGNIVHRDLECSIFNKEKMSAVLNGSTVGIRKQEALQYFANLKLDDINVALSKATLGQLRDGDLSKFNGVFQLIEEKGDCADFPLAPLLGSYLVNQAQFPVSFSKKIKELALNFRYWIDEPGSDVMWYFSENHALLFHISQYFAGYLYPNETFSVSNRLGKEQYQIGIQRLEEWFKQFEKYGFSEWNSITYLPIDLIGFFSLYIAAPDQKIKNLAKRALDFTFKIIAINYHGGTINATFGRVYEHNLKSMQLGEVSNLIDIAWHCGYFNNALRASALFCMSDYVPPVYLEDFILKDPNNYILTTYHQGKNRALTYQYKNADYSLSSVINYKPGEKGHQQHVMSISLGGATILWVNNPGESEYSGEGRPSYWAGNGVFPKIDQFRNIVYMQYDLKKAAHKFVHFYLPYWDLDEIIVKQNCLFIRKNKSYCVVYANEPFTINQNSKVKNRDVIWQGEKIELVIKCASENEIGDFKDFQQKVFMGLGSYESPIKDFKDFQFGIIEFNDGVITTNNHRNQIDDRDYFESNISI